MTKVLIDKEDIPSFIPHRRPIIMIDQLTYASQSAFESTFKIEADNIFLQKDNKLNELALIETMAQTCAAGLEYLDRQTQENKLPKIGFIGAITHLKVSRLAELNQLILTKIKLITQLENIFLFDGIATWHTYELLRCRLKIVVQEKN